MFVTFGFAGDGPKKEAVLVRMSPAPLKIADVIRLVAKQPPEIMEVMKNIKWACELDLSAPDVEEELADFLSNIGQEQPAESAGELIVRCAAEATLDRLLKGLFGA